MASPSPEAGPSKRQKKDDADDVPPGEEANKSEATSDPDLTKARAKATAAQFWYYKDQHATMQGPFYPGQMRQWLDADFLPKDMPMAPSTYGEVPQKFFTLEQLFSSPDQPDFREIAFYVPDGIAWMPAEELKPEELEEAKQKILDPDAEKNKEKKDVHKANNYSKPKGKWWD